MKPKQWCMHQKCIHKIRAVSYISVFHCRDRKYRYQFDMIFIIFDIQMANFVHYNFHIRRTRFPISQRDFYRKRTIFSKICNEWFPSAKWISAHTRHTTSTISRNDTRWQWCCCSSSSTVPEHLSNLYGDCKHQRDKRHVDQDADYGGQKTNKYGGRSKTFVEKMIQIIAVLNLFSSEFLNEEYSTTNDHLKVEPILLKIA